MFNKIPLAVENHSKSKKTSPNLIEEAMFLSAHESHIQQKLKPTKATAFEPVFWLGCLHRTTFFFRLVVIQSQPMKLPGSGAV